MSEIHNQQKGALFMKTFLVLTVVGALFGSPFLGKIAMADEYAQGKKLYGDKCQICHGVKGDGNGPAGAALSPKPADFTSPKFWQEETDQKIIETIKNGHGMMPSFDLNPIEIKDIIDYLSHTFKPKS
jgi:mono/diheme cytochrome c family protein